MSGPAFERGPGLSANAHESSAAFAYEKGTGCTAALYLAHLGYAVFPVWPNEKRPATPRGFHDASRDPDRIAGWWRQRPRCNVGLLPGDNVLALDVDDPTVLPSLVEPFCELAVAPLHRTPRGGAHLFVRVPLGWSMPARVGAVPGIDVRGLGRAYLVIPPSVVDGRAYIVVRPLVPPADLPPASLALLDFLKPAPAHHATLPGGRDIAPSRSRARSYGQVALEREAAEVAATPEGARNDRLNRAAFAVGGFVGAGVLDKTEAQVALVAAAVTCGLPRVEALRTIESGLTAGMQHPRVVLPGRVSVAARRFARWRRVREGRRGA